MARNLEKYLKDYMVQANDCLVRFHEEKEANVLCLSLDRTDLQILEEGLRRVPGTGDLFGYQESADRRIYYLIPKGQEDLFQDILQKSLRETTDPQNGASFWENTDTTSLVKTYVKAALGRSFQMVEAEFFT